MMSRPVDGADPAAPRKGSLLRTLNAVAWSFVLGVSVMGVYVGWNFFAVAFQKVAMGSSAASYEDTLFAGIRTWLGSAHFRAELAGGAIGMLWAAVESMGSVAIKEPPA